MKMKLNYLTRSLCLSCMLLFATASNVSSEDMECCCQITCHYVRVLLGSPTIIVVDQCWDEGTISSCDPDTACLKVKNNFLTYTNQWTGAGCSLQEKCISSFIYGSDDPQLDTLRAFRDEVLSQTPEGQELIELYYEWSPTIVETMEEDEEFKAEVKEMIDGVLLMME